MFLIMKVLLKNQKHGISEITKSITQVEDENKIAIDNFEENINKRLRKLDILKEDLVEKKLNKIVKNKVSTAEKRIENIAKKAKKEAKDVILDLEDEHNVLIEESKKHLEGQLTEIDNLKKEVNDKISESCNSVQMNINDMYAANKKKIEKKIKEQEAQNMQAVREKDFKEQTEIINKQLAYLADQIKKKDELITKNKERVVEEAKIYFEKRLIKQKYDMKLNSLAIQLNKIKEELSKIRNERNAIAKEFNKQQRILESNLETMIERKIQQYIGNGIEDIEIEKRPAHENTALNRMLLEEEMSTSQRTKLANATKKLGNLAGIKNQILAGNRKRG